MHHYVADVVQLKVSFLFLRMKLKHSHTLNLSLMIFLVWFGAVRTQEHSQVGFHIVCNIASKRDRTFSTEKFQLQKSLCIFNEHNFSGFIVLEVNVSLLFSRSDHLQCLLQFNNLFIHFICFVFKFAIVMANFTSISLSHSNHIELCLVIKNLKVVNFDAVRHVCNPWSNFFKLFFADICLKST